MSEIKKVIDQFKKIKIEANIQALPEDVQKALPHLYNAMDMITRIFLRQQHEQLPYHFDEVMSGNDEIKKEYYDLFKGPYNVLKDFKSEFSEIRPRRKGCAFYPDNLEDCQIVHKIEKLDKENSLGAKDHFSVLRFEDETLSIIPYHKYYGEELAEVFDELQAAAQIIEGEEFSSFLINKAEALISGSYRESDSQWVNLTTSSLDLVIGPYEVYADALIGLKATYESILMIVDFDKTSRFKEIKNNMKSLAEFFPLPNNSKAALGNSAPIIVADQIYSGGEASQGVMAAAFNLPNDVWVREHVGWKQMMLHNIMKAKFNSITKEISKRILEEGQNISFDPFFTFVLLHEISHGLGPAYREDGREVAKCLGADYVAIEETKADSGALFLMLKLGGQFGIEKYDHEVLMRSYLAGLFRSMRFGFHEAHGKSNLIQFNWFVEKGNIQYSGDQFSININKLEKHTEILLEKVCSLEASASVKEVQIFLDRYGKAEQQIRESIDKLKDLPIDIKAIFPGS